MVSAACPDTSCPTGSVLGAFVGAMLYDTVGSTLVEVREPELVVGERSPIASATATARVSERSEARAAA
jgi:hypothetical protein